MKKLLLTLILVMSVCFGLYAQQLTYQAVIRDANQQLVVNTPTTTYITINFAVGNPFRDTVNATTNIHGLLTFDFGDASLVGRDWENATITARVMNQATPSVVYVNNVTRPVSAAPYALSVNGQSIQNYLDAHHYSAARDSIHTLQTEVNGANTHINALTFDSLYSRGHSQSLLHLDSAYGFNVLNYGHLSNDVAAVYILNQPGSGVTSTSALTARDHSTSPSTIALLSARNAQGKAGVVGTAQTATDTVNGMLGFTNGELSAAVLANGPIAFSNGHLATDINNTETISDPASGYTLVTEKTLKSNISGLEAESNTHINALTFDSLYSRGHSQSLLHLDSAYGFNVLNYGHLSNDVAAVYILNQPGTGVTSTSALTARDDDTNPSTIALLSAQNAQGKAGVVGTAQTSNGPVNGMLGFTNGSLSAAVLANGPIAFSNGHYANDINNTDSISDPASGYTLVTEKTLKSNISGLEAKSHSHTNKAVLDRTQQAYRTTDSTKLARIAEGAEVNVQSDWNATSGDEQILNKPRLDTMASVSNLNALADRVTTAEGEIDALQTATTGVITSSNLCSSIESSCTNVALANGNNAFSGNNTFTGNNTIGGTSTTTTLQGTVTVPSGFTFETSPCTQNAVNACDLLAVFDSLQREIASLRARIDAFQPTTTLPTVTTSSVSAIATTTATCGGNVTEDGGATVTARGVCWSTSQNPTVADSHTSDGTGTGSFASSITGLAPGTTYYVRAYATNTEGTAYGDQVSFTTADPCLGAATVTDIDGNVYNTVQIGSQCWMKENLKTTKYADGTSISSGTTTSTTDAYWYYPDDNSSNKATYGLLYNWKAVMGTSSSSTSNPSGVQGICPTGWHVPSDAEWTQLTTYVGSQNQYQCGGSSSQIAKALASTTGWNSSTTTCEVGNTPSANNATGFSAVPAGNYYYGNYYNFGDYAYYWSATQGNGNFANCRSLSYYTAGVGSGYNNKSNAYSVRCLRDN